MHVYDSHIYGCQCVLLGHLPDKMLDMSLIHQYVCKPKDAEFATVAYMVDII